ncbi:MAG: peptidoglycan recognition protein family protein [Armatimonadota bacterium]
MSIATYLIRWKLQARELARQGFPAGIVIHHTSTPPVERGQRVDVAFIDALHERRGFGKTDTDGTIYHIGYHYLVLQDGTVRRGRPEHLTGAHTRGHNNTLGIALVGDYDGWKNFGQRGPAVPPAKQLAAAERLTRSLLTKYDLTADDVYLHRELVISLCPGNRFPQKTFMQAIRGN